MSFRTTAGQSVVEGDFSKLEKLIENLGQEYHVDIGVFSTAKTPGGKSIAEYGAYNEFGSISKPNRPPKRSFIRAPLMSGQDKIAAYVSKRAAAHLENGDVRAVFEDIGIAGESVSQESFETRGAGTWKENAESTVDKKGSSAPLIDTGLLRQSITHRVGGDGNS